MVFSTPYFLYLYLPICLALYYITPQRGRNFTLLSLSLLFYFWGERVYVAIMFASIFIDYIHGILVEHFKNQGKDFKARLAVASSMVFNLSLLGFFKYWDFLAESLQWAGLDLMPVLGIHLPIGISFYTFQTMSYTIDVYRGDAKAQRNIINFGAYVTLFPQLIAGPILKYKDLGDQLDHRDHTISRFVSGIEIFIIGLSKKVLLANNVGKLWESYLATAPEDLSILGAWMGVLAFTFQIYFDFSGYSDMAVGLGRMLGFEFLGNFNYPLTACSITDFWRRWHISLSSWFRQYLYIPLGGNRCSPKRWIFNLFLVWSATGIWHGASWNFMLWGIIFFFVLLLEKFIIGKSLEKATPLVARVYTMFVILVSMTVFAIEDFSHLLDYLKVMFGVGSVPLLGQVACYQFSNYGVMLVVCAIGATPIVAQKYKSLPKKTTMITTPILLLAGLILSSAYLVDGTYNPFLYFRH